MEGKGTRRNAIPSPYRVSLLRERKSLGRVKRFEILREGKRDFVSIGGVCLSKPTFLEMKKQSFFKYYLIIK